MYANVVRDLTLPVSQVLIECIEFCALGHHMLHQSISFGFISRQPKIAIRVGCHIVNGFAGAANVLDVLPGDTLNGNPQNSRSPTT